MTAREQLIRARMGMLALADQLQNISVACKRAGISRSHYYEIKAAFEKYGRDGLAPCERRRPRMPNETPPELVEKILEMTAKYPTYSYVRISQQLRQTRNLYCTLAWRVDSFTFETARRTPSIALSPSLPGSSRRMIRPPILGAAGLTFNG